MIFGFLPLVVLCFVMIEVIEYEMSKLHCIIIMSAFMIIISNVNIIFTLPANLLDYSYIMLGSVVAMASFRIYALKILKKRDPDDYL